MSSEQLSAEWFDKAEQDISVLAERLGPEALEAGKLSLASGLLGALENACATPSIRRSRAVRERRADSMITFWLPFLYYPSQGRDPSGEVNHPYSESFSWFQSWRAMPRPELLCQRRCLDL